MNDGGGRELYATYNRHTARPPTDKIFLRKFTS